MNLNFEDGNLWHNNRKCQEEKYNSTEYKWNHMATDQNTLSKIWLKSTLSVAIFIQDPWDTTAMANCKNSSW
jgi:hypothetical protein